MACKVTFTFEIGPYGWSESYFHAGEDPAAIGFDVAALELVRAPLLGIGALLTSTHTSNVDRERDAVVTTGNIGPGDNAELKVDGVSNTDADMPWSGILVEMRNSPSKKGHIFMRGVPDFILQGVPPRLKLTEAWKAGFLKYATILKNGVWSIQLQKLPPAQPSPAIVSFTKPGGGNLLMTFAAAPGWATGDTVFIYKGTQTGAADFRLPTEEYKIAKVSDTTFTLDKSGVKYAGVGADGAELKYAANSAKARKVEFQYLPITAVKELRPVQRRTGRPFGGQVGRKRAK